MKFSISCTSQWNNIDKYKDVLSKYELTNEKHSSITINTIEELVQLSNDVGEYLIIDDDSIEIYDYYRE